MEYNENFMQSTIQDMLIAFAYHKIITDNYGKPIDFNYLEVNNAFEKLTGLKRENIIGKTVKEILVDFESEKFVWSNLLSDESIYNNTLNIEHYFSDSGKWGKISIFSPHKGYFFSVITDITEEKEREQELLKTNAELISKDENYRMLVDNLQDVVYTCDSNGVILIVNEMFSKLTNKPADQLIGMKMAEVLSEFNLDEKWIKAFNNVISRKKTISFENTLYLKNKDVIYNVTLTPIIKDGNVIGVTGINHNVTELKKREDYYFRLAYYDSLTRLPNRILFLDRLKNAMEISRRNGTKVVVAYLDMDNFKNVNDSYGHAIGDQLLVAASKRIQSCMRGYDTVARLSGDEFSILIQDVDNVNAVIGIFERVKEVFYESFILGNSIVYVTVSIGVSVFPDDGNNVDEILRNADVAMYKTKEIGKNSIQFFNEKMKNELLKKYNTEILLKKAIAQKEFVLYYQPQYEVKTKRLRGFEALIRWNSPELGLLKPADFIYIAEGDGMTPIIGKWVLDTACKFVRKVNSLYKNNIIIAVNISPTQFVQKDFYFNVVDAVNNSGINPSCLELEVTEGIFVDDIDFAIDIINDLKKFGVRIALDGFGTGYSSLNHLMKVPIDILKIDRTFIRDIIEHNPDNDIVNSIIALIQKLNIETFAGGVENKELLEYLINANFDNLQGYYLGEPVPESQTNEILKSTL